MDRRDYYAVFGALLPRGHKVNENNMTLSFTLEDDESVEQEYTLPVKYEVCDTCRGTGHHVSPSIDAHGIGAEEWEQDWDEDDREKYRSGFYDVACSECKGRHVVPTVDEDAADPKILQMLRDWQDAEAEYRSASTAERGW